MSEPAPPDIVFLGIPVNDDFNRAYAEFAGETYEPWPPHEPECRYAIECDLHKGWTWIHPETQTAILEHAAAGKEWNFLCLFCIGAVWTSDYEIVARKLADGRTVAAIGPAKGPAL
jgi:hypothetical protein